MNVSYKRAIAFLELHGNVMHTAFTPDGIIATSWVRQNDSAELQGDVWFEETVVFEVREDGSVDSAAIRRWLGY
jgi:hypothetical protein